MCTVTLHYNGKQNFILTSNRDEAPSREAIFPQFYSEKGIKLLYPKDPVSNGTWIGLSQKKRLICLLNGGYEQHVRSDHYRLSRGVVVKDLLASNTIALEVDRYNLEGVEPFTLVIVDWFSEIQFFELVWDGHKKHFSELPLDTHIWSSSTLYTSQMKEKRKQWFADFKNEETLTSDNLLKFHKTAGIGNLDYGVVMDRGHVKTTSITQVVKNASEVKMRYENMTNGNFEFTNFNSLEAINE